MANHANHHLEDDDGIDHSAIASTSYSLESNWRDGEDLHGYTNCLRDSNDLEHVDEHVDDNSITKASVDLDASVIDRFGFFQAMDESSLSTSISSTLIRKRERKWIEMLSNWPYYMEKNFHIVKKRCRKGIPSSLRGRAWKYLCGAAFHMEFSLNKTVFDELVKLPGNDFWIAEIRKDINRQFPQHILFSGSGPYGKTGRNDLFELLKAYTILHPEDGYCQAQAPVACVLLMHMPLKDAFYCFVQICHKYLPRYYAAGLEAVQIDGDILMNTLRQKSKNSFEILKRHNVEPTYFMIEWFMCIYCRSLPWPTVLRIWDIFFCEGVKVLFKVAVVLFQYGLGSKSHLKEFDDFHGVITRLKSLPKEIVAENFLIDKVNKLDLDDTEMERIHCRVVKTWQMRLSVNSDT